MNKYPLVYCIWEDIQGSSGEWKTVDDAINWNDTEDSLVHQVGFQLDKSDEYVILIDSFFPNQDLVGTVIRIPIGAIRKLKIIEYKDYL